MFSEQRSIANLRISWALNFISKTVIWNIKEKFEIFKMYWEKLQIHLVRNRKHIPAVYKTFFPKNGTKLELNI